MLKVFSPWKSKRKKKPNNYEVWLANLPVVHVRKFGSTADSWEHSSGVILGVGIQWCLRLRVSCPHNA